MDVDSIAAVASNMAAARTADQVQVAVLKKVLDSQAAGALALLQALPQAPSPNLPAHLGRNIDTTA